MQANRDDAPSRLNRKHNNKVVLFALVAATTIITSGLYMAGKVPGIPRPALQSISIPLAAQAAQPLKALGKTHPQPVIEVIQDAYLNQANQVLNIISDYPAARPIAEIHWSADSPDESSKSDRQTVFTDDNYRPITTVNTISMPRPVPNQVQAQQDRPYVSVVKETRRSCWPAKPGSIECRRIRARMYKNYSNACMRNGDSQSAVCQLARAYEPRR